MISDQYKPATVATSRRQGLQWNAGRDRRAEPGALAIGWHQGDDPQGPKSTQKKESNVSVMPDGLINTLSYQEIADMLALFDSCPAGGTSATQEMKPAK